MSTVEQINLSLPEDKPKDKMVTIEETKKPRKAWRWIFKNKMLAFTLVGVLVGTTIGLTFKSSNLHPDLILVISYPGELFMRMLKLVILPLIVSSLIAGTSSLNSNMKGKVAGRTFSFFALTSSYNVLVGILLALAIHPGKPRETNVVRKTLKSISLLDSMLDLGRNIIPDNLFQATFEQQHTVYEKRDLLEDYESGQEAFVKKLVYMPGVNTLGIVLFSIVFGITIANSGEKARVVGEFFEAVFEVMMRLITNTVMVCTPIGVASIIAGKILSVNDLGHVLTQLAWLVLTTLIGVYLYQLVVLQLIYFLILRKNPYKFYHQLLNPMLTTFACASTAAALPMTFRVMKEKLHIDSRITKFILPIGCNINMDGTAVFIPMATIFIAQLNHIDLGMGELVVIFFLSLAASFSASSVPSASLVMVLMVTSAIHLPTHDVTLFFAIDWFLDRFRSTNNMLSDCYAVAVVAHLSQDELSAMDGQLESQRSSKLLMDPAQKMEEV